MKVLKLYKYLYYRLYSWNLKTWGMEDAPQWNALLGVSFMMFLNLLLLGHVLQYFDVNIFLREETPKKEAVAIGVILLGINYFIFIYKNKYKVIENQFKKETKWQRRKNALLLWLYVILSFALFVFGAILVRNLKGL